jgi:hypothetical protein
MQDTTGDVWTDGLGRRAGTVYYDALGHRRVVTAPAVYDGDDNLVATGAEAVATFSAIVDAHQIRRRHALRKLGAAARPRARSRGAGRPKVRSSARRSSERSGDSGEEGSEPPGRSCACGCGRDITHRAPQAKYLNDTHAAADRQRRKRGRARDWSPDVSRRDPYLRLDAAELARLRNRIEQGCRCNGSHIADPGDRHCLKCGHRRGWSLPVGLAVPARSAETRRPRSSEVAA